MINGKEPDNVVLFDQYKCTIVVSDVVSDEYKVLYTHTLFHHDRCISQTVESLAVVPFSFDFFFELQQHLLRFLQ
ncbi:GvpL/GvpF family gas vesicle protein [Bartonella sp. CDC_skunk]|uniref:GvpL/GvpF family gas vesicle protein n=1 Tax=Bartonella TaxID=773 RepID=UPI00129464F5